jgi:hypothetical protein
LLCTSDAAHRGENESDTVTLADQPSLDAAEHWQNVMQNKEGEDYIRQARFNCTNKYDDAAIKALVNAPVSQITVGYEPNATLYKASCPQ